MDIRMDDGMTILLKKNELIGISGETYEGMISHLLLWSLLPIVDHFGALVTALSKSGCRWRYGHTCG